MTDAPATMHDFSIIFATARHPEVGCILPGDLGGLTILPFGDESEAFLAKVDAAMDAIGSDCEAWNDQVESYEDDDEDSDEEWAGRTPDETTCIWGEWIVSARDYDSLCAALDEDRDEVLSGNFFGGSDDEEEVLGAMDY